MITYESEHLDIGIFESQDPRSRKCRFIWGAPQRNTNASGGWVLFDVPISRVRVSNFPGGRGRVSVLHIWHGCVPFRWPDEFQYGALSEIRKEFLFAVAPQQESYRRFFEVVPYGRRSVATGYASSIDSFSTICQIAEIGTRGEYAESFSGAIELLAAIGPRLLEMVERSESLMSQLPVDNLDIILSAIGRVSGVEVGRKVKLLQRIVHSKSAAQLFESYLDALSEIGHQFSGVRYLIAGLINDVAVMHRVSWPEIAQMAETMLREEWVPPGVAATI